MLEGDRGGEQAEGDGLFAEITQELLFLLDYATYEAISMWIKRTLDSLEILHKRHGYKSFTE